MKLKGKCLLIIIFIISADYFFFFAAQVWNQHSQTVTICLMYIPKDFETF